MSELDAAIRQFRHLRAQREASTALALKDAYEAARDSLRRDLNQMVTWIEEEQAAGRDIPKWRLIQEARTQRLLRQAQFAFRQYSDEVGHTIINEQRAAVSQSLDDAHRLIEASFGPTPLGATLPVAALPHQAIERLVASLHPDAPVWNLLNEFAGNAAKTVQDQLISGMAKGQNPRVIARSISETLGGQYDRALTIVRTETLRAHRGAQLEVYKKNSHLLKGWRWTSAKDQRTCPVCLALDGRVFKLTEPARMHVNCRCSVTPVTKSYRDLGYDVDEPTSDIETGAEWFARQPAGVQHGVLGASAYKAYAAGDVQLEDFVVLSRSGTWGSSYVRGSLDGALGRAAARQQRAA